MSDTSEDQDTDIKPLKDERDFYLWKSMIKLHLVSLELWSITSGATPRPTSDVSPPTPAQEAWDRSSLLARCFLGRHLSESIIRHYYFYATAPEVWTALMVRYHRNDTASLLASFTAVSSLRYTDTSTESFGDYLDCFGQRWDDLRYRTDDADPPTPGEEASLETALHVVATSDESKREFLVASLPAAMGVFVVELQGRLGGDLDYFRLERELVGYYGRMELGKGKQEAQGGECTWCRARGLESGGHGWRACARLREFKIQRR